MVSLASFLDQNIIQVHPRTKKVATTLQRYVRIECTHTCIPHSIEMVLEVDSPNDIFDTK